MSRQQVEAPTTPGRQPALHVGGPTPRVTHQAATEKFWKNRAEAGIAGLAQRKAAELLSAALEN